MGRRQKYKSDWVAKNPIHLVKIFDRQKDLKIDKGSARALVLSLLEYLKISSGEIAVYFVSQKKIAELHDEFFQNSTPTDCISFPLGGNDLGEIFVCPEAAIAYAKGKGLDPYEETSLYIVHGLLHLLGFNDLDPIERRTMRKKEKNCMGYLYEQKTILAAK